MSRIKYKKLSRDDPDKTIICAGNEKIALDDLEKGDSDIKRKLKNIESELEKY